MKKCKHEKRRVSGVADDRAKAIVCETCGERWEVPFSAEEKRLWREKRKREDWRIKAIHGLVWEFQKTFYQHRRSRLSPKHYAQEVEMAKLVYKGGWRKKVSRYRLVRDGWKYSGFEMMGQLERFAKKHPEVILLHCDDSWHASSTIVLIPHRAKDEYWGTTMVMVPQCTGEPPLEMFLYPRHAQEIERVLRELNQEQQRKLQLKKRLDYWPKP